MVRQLGLAAQEPAPSAGVITDLRRQIRDIDEEFISGVIVRSKELWVEQGEKPTKYFFNLEKMRQQKKEMTELKYHSSELLSDSKDIRKEMNDFYQDLFSEEEVDLEAQEWLLDQLSMSLDEQEQASCEGLLTVEECREALNGMDTGKSPGIFGLTAEFYIAFWAVLGSDLVEVLNYGFQHGQLSISQRRGLLSLIFKKGGKGTLRIGGQYLSFVLIIKSAPRLSQLDYRKFCLLFCTRTRPVVFQGDLFFKHETCQRSDRVLQF